MNLLEILNFAKEYLEKYSFSKPRLESEKMIAHVLRMERMYLYTNYDKSLAEDEKKQIKAYLLQMAQTKKSFEEIQEQEGSKKPSFREENQELLAKSIRYLEKHGVETAKLDAEYIFAEILSVNRNMLTLYFDREIREDQKKIIGELLIQRGKHRKPLQYLLGKWEFYGYEFIVDERALIPRADTEILVEQVKIIAMEKEEPKILDIGTGSGAISIALAKELPTSTVVGVDISEAALSLAKENKDYQMADNAYFMQSDLYSAFEGKGKRFDIIVSNPPYIPIEEYEELMPEVKNYEPQNALTDLGDGYSLYEKMIKGAKDYLEEKGYLFFEVGYQQAGKIKDWMEKEGFEGICIVKDYGGHQRVVFGRKGVKE